MTVLSEQQREDLKTELAALDAAASPIAEAMAPFKKVEAELQNVRALTLQRYGLTEDPQTCGSCEGIIISGDNAHVCYDGDPILCEACSPTFDDLLTQLEEESKAPDTSSREPDELATALAGVRARVAAGDGQIKNVWPWGV